MEEQHKQSITINWIRFGLMTKPGKTQSLYGRPVLIFTHFHTSTGSCPRRVPGVSRREQLSPAGVPQHGQLSPAYPLSPACPRPGVSPAGAARAVVPGGCGESSCPRRVRVGCFHGWGDFLLLSSFPCTGVVGCGPVCNGAKCVRYDMVFVVSLDRHFIPTLNCFSFGSTTRRFPSFRFRHLSYFRLY